VPQACAFIGDCGEALRLEQEQRTMQGELSDLIDTAAKKRDELQQFVEACQKRCGRNDGGRELALAKTKLQEVGYWLAQAAQITGQK
jgi:hypothetical protein